MADQCWVRSMKALAPSLGQLGACHIAPVPYGQLVAESSAVPMRSWVTIRYDVSGSCSVPSVSGGIQRECSNDREHTDAQQMGAGQALKDRVHADPKHDHPEQEPAVRAGGKDGPAANGAD